MRKNMSKIIKEGHDQYRSWPLPSINSSHIVNRASEESSSLSSNLRANVQQKKREEGFEKGYREGMAAAEKVKQQYAQQIKHFEQLLLTLNEPFKELDQQVEEELVALAVAIAKQIIRRELKTDPRQVMAVIREALATLPASSRNVKIALHPEDAAFVQSLSKVPEENQTWVLVEDPTLMPGGCKVTTDTSRIDASIESRLAAIFAQILGGEREQDKPAS